MIMVTQTNTAQGAGKARKAKKPPSPARLQAMAAVDQAKKAYEAAKSPQEKTVAEEKLRQTTEALKVLRFNEIGTARIKRALNVLRQLENIASPASYSWTEAQAKQAVTALENGVKRVADKLARVKGSKKVDFAFS
jgi:hypothetical protein